MNVCDYTHTSGMSVKQYPSGASVRLHPYEQRWTPPADHVAITLAGNTPVDGLMLVKVEAGQEVARFVTKSNRRRPLNPSGAMDDGTPEWATAALVMAGHAA